MPLPIGVTIRYYWRTSCRDVFTVGQMSFRTVRTCFFVCSIMDLLLLFLLSVNNTQDVCDNWKIKSAIFGRYSPVELYIHTVECDVRNWLLSHIVRVHVGYISSTLAKLMTSVTGLSETSCNCRRIFLLIISCSTYCTIRKRKQWQYTSGPLGCL